MVYYHTIYRYVFNSLFVGVVVISEGLAYVLVQLVSQFSKAIDGLVFTLEHTHTHTHTLLAYRTDI